MSKEKDEIIKKLQFDVALWKDTYENCRDELELLEKEHQRQIDVLKNEVKEWKEGADVEAQRGDELFEENKRIRQEFAKEIFDWLEENDMIIMDFANLIISDELDRLKQKLTEMKK